MAVQPEKSRKTSTPPDTWTVRGVPPETRAVAKRAAARAGKTLGEWVDDALRRAATERLAEALPAVQEAPRPARGALEAVLSRLEALERASQAREAPRPPRSFWRRFLGLSERA